MANFVKRPRASDPCDASIPSTTNAYPMQEQLCDDEDCSIPNGEPWEEQDEDEVVVSPFTSTSSQITDLS